MTTERKRSFCNGPQAYRACVHEAGHAIVAAVFGWPVEAVRVVYSTRDGNTFVAGVTEFDPLAPYPAIPIAEQVKRRCIIGVAGAMAERLGLGNSSPVDAGDRAELDGAPDVGMTHKQLQREAVLILHKHWPAVVELTERLAETGAVTGDEVQAVLKEY